MPGFFRFFREPKSGNEFKRISVALNYAGIIQYENGQSVVARNARTEYWKI